MELNNYLGKIVDVIIDRPLGKPHPQYNDLIYEINYGYIPNTISGDGEEIDVYILDVDKPINFCKAKIIAIIKRNNDIEDKLVAVCDETKIFSDEEILKKTFFIEKWYDSKILK